MVSNVSPATLRFGDVVIADGDVATVRSWLDDNPEELSNDERRRANQVLRRIDRLFATRGVRAQPVRVRSLVLTVIAAGLAVGIAIQVASAAHPWMSVKSPIGGSPELWPGLVSTILTPLAIAFVATAVLAIGSPTWARVLLAIAAFSTIVWLLIAVPASFASLQSDAAPVVGLLFALLATTIVATAIGARR